jgi:hypothetical protein
VAGRSLNAGTSEKPLPNPKPKLGPPARHVTGPTERAQTPTPTSPLTQTGFALALLCEHQRYGNRNFARAPFAGSQAYASCMSPRCRHRFARRGLLSAVVGALACVVLAAPVSAFVSRRTHITIVPAVPPVIPNQGSGQGTLRVTFGSSTATCPTGQHVLFGGFENVATGMRRTANDRWTAGGFNVFVDIQGASNTPRSLYSMAYCGRGPVPSKATSTVEIRYRSGRASGSATARCPAGTVVVAGGFATTPHSAVFVTGLERVAADLWRVSADVNPNLSATHTALTSIAYCGPGPAPKLVSKTVTSFVHGGGLGLARATCPVGTHLVFGGAIVTGLGDPFLQTLRVPLNTKNTWAVTGRGGSDGRLTALAYCR